MPGSRWFIVLIIGCLFPVSLFGADQGIAIEETTLTTLRGKETKVVKKIYCTRSMMLVVDSSTTVKMLYKIPEKKVFLIDDRQRTYQVQTITDLEKRLQQLLPKTQSMKTVVKPTGTKRTIIGHSCDGFTLSTPQQSVTVSLWVSGALNLPMDTVYTLMTMNGSPAPGSSISDLVKKRNGYILESITKTRLPSSKDVIVIHTKVNRIAKQTIPEQLFEMPRGYLEQAAVSAP